MQCIQTSDHTATLNVLTLFSTMYLPGLRFWEVLTGFQRVGQAQVYGLQKYLNSWAPIGLGVYIFLF